MGLQVVLGLDDQAPSSPDEASAGQGKVLCERELLDGSRKVRDTGKDKSPLCHIELVTIRTGRYIAFIFNIPS